MPLNYLLGSTSNHFYRRFNSGCLRQRFLVVSRSRHWTEELFARSPNRLALLFRESKPLVDTEQWSARAVKQTNKQTN